MFNLNDSDIQRVLAENGAPDGTNGAGLLGTSKRTMARFYMHATKDGDESLRLGRTIYKEAPFVEMWAEGSKDTASHPVDAGDIRAYPQEWAEFQRQRTDPVHSVMALPTFSACMRRYCEDAEIFTIEKLAASEVQPELAELKAMAHRWLEMANGKPPQVRKGWPKGKPRGKKAAPDVQVA